MKWRIHLRCLSFRVNCCRLSLGWIRLNSLIRKNKLWRGLRFWSCWSLWWLTTSACRSDSSFLSLSLGVWTQKCMNMKLDIWFTRNDIAIIKNSGIKHIGDLWNFTGWVHNWHLINDPLRSWRLLRFTRLVYNVVKSLSYSCNWWFLICHCFVCNRLIRPRSNLLLWYYHGRPTLKFS